MKPLRVIHVNQKRSSLTHWEPRGAQQTQKKIYILSDASDALCGRILKHALNQHTKDKEHSLWGILSDTKLFKREKKYFFLCHSELLPRAFHGRTSSLCNGFKTNYTTHMQQCMILRKRKDRPSFTQPTKL